MQGFKVMQPVCLELKELLLFTVAAVVLVLLRRCAQNCALCIQNIFGDRDLVHPPPAPDTHIHLAGRTEAARPLRVQDVLLPVFLDLAVMAVQHYQNKRRQEQQQEEAAAAAA